MKKNYSIYDFSDYAEEVTGDALFKINGGAEVENSHEGVAGANVGDTLTRKDGTVVVINQGDIDYAKRQLGVDENSTSPNDNTQPTVTGVPDGYNYSGEYGSESQNSNPEVPEEIKSNSNTYAYYMTLQKCAKEEGNPDKYKNYNLYQYAGNNTLLYLNSTGRWVDNEAGETVESKQVSISINSISNKQIWDFNCGKSTDGLTRGLYSSGVINYDLANNGQLNFTADLGIAEYGFKSEVLSLFGGKFKIGIDGSIGAFTAQESVGIKDFGLGADADISMLKIAGTIHLSLFGNNSKISCEGFLGGLAAGKRFGLNLFNKYAHGIGGSISVAPENIIYEKK